MRYLLVNSIYKGCKKLFFALFFTSTLLACQATGFASNIPERPAPPRLVNDFAGILSPSQINRLEQKLVHYNDTTSNQIVVVLVQDIGMNTAANFAYAIGEQWGVGQSRHNNGAVVLVQPKTARNRGHAFIATGYGLEGAIPDALAKRIVDYEMIPLFRQDDYYNGINNALNAMIALAAGEYTADEYRSAHSEEVPGAWFVPLFVLLIIFFMVGRSRTANHIGNKRSSLPFWTALFLASQAGRRHPGSFKSFSGGSGFGRGGFGGFGGGSFGGGGAGGSW